MKKHSGVFIVMLIMIITAGCSAPTEETSSRISRPHVNVAPLQGTWRIDSCITQDSNVSQKTSEDRLMGMELGFSRDAIVFGPYIWKDVTYKVKTVDTVKYFEQRSIDADGKLGFTGRDLPVIQASSGEKYLYEFAQVGEDRIVVNVEGNLYLLKKVSPKFSGTAKQPASPNSPEFADESRDTARELNSGIFLGIRTLKKNPQETAARENVAYDYQTWWLAFSENRLRPVLAAPDIFLPRKDGYWIVKARRTSVNGVLSDIVSASRVIAGNTVQYALPESPENGAAFVRPTRDRTILYVGNDYICFEDTLNANDKSGQPFNQKVLRTLPVDGMNDFRGVSLYDLAGSSGYLALEEAFSNLAGSSKNSGTQITYASDVDYNYALFRKNGHWFFKGRLNFEKESPVPYTDFNLNLLPPSNMVAYDNLQVPWTVIMNKVPQAVDAYTSPNKDMALVLTRNLLMVFAVRNNDILGEPLAKIPLDEGSTVVMAEWSTGNYVKKWEKAFSGNNNVRELKSEGH